MGSTTIKECPLCGASFTGGHHATFCPDCRKVRKRKQAAQAQARRRAGTSGKRLERNRKTCVVCGTEFECPPSAKTVTCSPVCRSLRAKSSMKHRWATEPGRLRADESSIRKRTENPVWREKAKASAKRASDASLLLPESQRGPQNRTAKNWILIDPDGNHIEVTNLLDWAREYYDFFEPDSDDIDLSARRIANGFRAIAGYMRGVPSCKRPVTSYKGWGLYALPTKKED